MGTEVKTVAGATPRLRRTLTLWDLILYGMIVLQPVAPMSAFGALSDRGRGHVVTAILIAMVAMLFTAISYGMLARVHPSAGSAYTYVGQEIHPGIGYLTGWAMVMDYILNPLICTILCSKLTQNILPEVPYWVLAVFYAVAFTALNLRGVKTSARINDVLAGAMTIVVIVFFAYVARFLIQLHTYGPGFFSKPFYDPATFNLNLIFHGTSIAVLTYIGFDAISTLSEEVTSDDKRTVGRAIIGVLFLSAGLFGVLSWVLGDLMSGFSLKDPAAAVYEVAEWAVGPWLSITIAWAMATVVGLASALPMQVGVARVMYAMGRDRQLPAALARVHPVYGTPYVGMLVTAAISIGVALAMRNRLDDLTAVVNFGALSGFLLLHVSVIVLFWVRRRTGRWLVHLGVPLAGIAVVLAVLSGMSSLAMMLGLTWLGIGLAYGALLRRRRRTELTL